MKFANIHVTTHVVTYTISFFITTILNVDLDEQQRQINYFYQYKDCDILHLDYHVIVSATTSVMQNRLITNKV